MRTKLFAGVAFAALILPTSAWAQSTGTVDFEESGDVIVVTGRVDRGLGGVEVSDTAKAKGTLNQAFISRQTPGNSILDTINQLPGVSFQNNDPFGSAGGTLTVRGFDSTRISLTFDGIPLNDTGNYAVYSNQQLDPELIEAVSVNYGSTDVDSPTAAASGSTVNYRTRNPSDHFGVRVLGSAGSFDFMRIFGVVDTGVFTSIGTKAWFSASTASNRWFVNDFGKIRKQQYNAKVYQPIGDEGDFVAVSVNYNENRNNFGGSAPLRYDTNVFSQSTSAPNSAGNPGLVTGALRTPGPNSTNRFPLNMDEIPYHVTRCTVLPGGPGAQTSNTTVPTAPGPALGASGCGTTFDERYNPSNTGSIRFNGRFTMAPGLVLTLDPSFQYVKANGGGTVDAREAANDIDPTGGFANCTTVTSGAGVNCQSGYYGGKAYAGHDLNGDGDLLDIVNVLAPSQTQTMRFGVIAGLRYDISDTQTIRVGYTWDRGRHRQTGEVTYLQPNGFPTDVFATNNPILGSAGQRLEKRDRLSYAIVNQISGEYRGEFGGLTVTVGVRAPFLERDLNQNCFTSSSGGFVECGGNGTINAYLGAIHPYTVNSNNIPTAATGAQAPWSPPQTRVYKYNAVLPNVGLTWKANQNFTAFFSYARGFQGPGTDNLYNAFYYPRNSEQANPIPETTDNFDAGVRYVSSNLQVQVGPWFTRFTNRLASAYDPDTQSTFYRNLGRVDKYGVDANVDWAPIPEVLVHLFGSYLKSEIKENVVLGNCPTTLTTANTTNNCTVAGAPIYALTAGKRESGAPTYTFGGRIQGSVGPVDFGIQAKRTGPRYLNDQNLPQIQCTGSLVNTICPTVANTPTTYTGTRGIQYTDYDAATPAYTLVDLDARVSLDWIGLNKKTYLQLNVQNVFNQYYVGGFSGGATNLTTVPFAQIGTPRTFIGTLNVAF